MVGFAHQNLDMVGKAYHPVIMLFCKREIHLAFYSDFNLF